MIVLLIQMKVNLKIFILQELKLMKEIQVMVIIIIIQLKPAFNLNTTGKPRSLRDLVGGGNTPSLADGSSSEEE